MAANERVRDRGRRNARQLREHLSRELRHARLEAGLSQSVVAQAVGLSQSVVSRLERAEPGSASLENLCAISAALGLRPSIKLYPDGPPVRDAPQLHLLDRLRGRIHRSFRWTSEAPVGPVGDLRAWDVRLDGPGSIGVDAETRLHDVQSLQRRFELKVRDSGVERAVLVVSATHHNRLVIREFRVALRSTFPGEARETLVALERGRLPDENGIIVL
jgi:transcriptional regulator with XRE-family HTH domain